MPQLRVHSISMSLDGYAAGPDQDRQYPLGVGGIAFTPGRSPPAASAR